MQTGIGCTGSQVSEDTCSFSGKFWEGLWSRRWRVSTLEWL